MNYIMDYIWLEMFWLVFSDHVLSWSSFSVDPSATSRHVFKTDLLPTSCNFLVRTT